MKPCRQAVHHNLFVSGKSRGLLLKDNLSNGKQPPGPQGTGVGWGFGLWLGESWSQQWRIVCQNEAPVWFRLLGCERSGSSWSRWVSRDLLLLPHKVCPKDEFGLSITSFLVSLGWEHINCLQGEKNESINTNIRLFKMFSGGQRENVS